MKQSNLATSLALFLKDQGLDIPQLLQPATPTSSLTRSEVIEWIDCQFEQIMDNPANRRPFEAWLLGNLTAVDKQALQLITDYDPYLNPIEPSDCPWRFLNYQREIAVTHDPAIAASYYVYFKVTIEATPLAPVQAYDNVRIVGEESDTIQRHDNARYIDTRPFLIDAVYLVNAFAEFPDWENYINEVNTKALLTEASYFLDGYEDTVELRYASKTNPGEPYFTFVAENEECTIRKVTYDDADTIIIYAKVDPDRMYDWWEKTPVPIEALRLDMQRLINEHVQEAFWEYPNGTAPIPGHPHLHALFDPEQRAMYIYEKGTDPRKGERWPYDYKNSVERNLLSYAEELRERDYAQTTRNHRTL